MSKKSPKKKLQLRALWQNPSCSRLGERHQQPQPPMGGNIMQEQIDSRSKAFNLVHNTMVGLEVSFQRDINALQRKYSLEYMKPLQALRSSLLALVSSRSHKPSGTEILGKIKKTNVFAQGSVQYQVLVRHCHLLLSGNPQEKSQKFNDNFWLQTLKNCDLVKQDIIIDKDEMILKYLSDINCETLGIKNADGNEDEVNGFQVSFKFATNPYFKNRRLVKRYVIDIYPKEKEGMTQADFEVRDESLLEGDSLLSYNGPRLIEITGTDIIWKDTITAKKMKESYEVKGEMDEYEITSMVSYFQTSWSENMNKRSSLAEHDFSIGTYFRDTLITNALAIHRNNFVHPKSGASSMTLGSNKSFSAIDAATRGSTAQISIKSSFSTSTIKNNEALKGEDHTAGSSRAPPNISNMQHQQRTSPNNPLNTKRGLISVLQGGNSPKITYVGKNPNSEGLQLRSPDSKEPDFERKGTGRKRGFPKSCLRDFEKRYPVKYYVPSINEQHYNTNPLPVPPPTCASHSATSTRINKLLKLSGKLNAGSNSFQVPKPSCGPNLESDDSNSFQVPKPSCGPNLESDDESAWDDVPLDPLSAMAEANDISQVLRQEDKKKRRTSRINKLKEAAAASRDKKKKFAAHQLILRKVASTTIVGTSKTLASTCKATASKKKATKKRTRRRYVILKAARRKTNPKFFDVKKRFLKRRLRLRGKRIVSNKPNSTNPFTPTVKSKSSWLTVSDNMDGKSVASVATSESFSGSGSELGQGSRSPSGSELGSESGSASGSGVDSASGPESEQQPPPSGSTCNPRQIICMGNKRKDKRLKVKSLKQISAKTSAKSKSNSKLNRRRKPKLSKGITPKLWQDFIKSHCSLKTASNSPPQLFAVGKIELRTTAIVDSLKMISSKSSQPATEEVASCSYAETPHVPYLKTISSKSNQSATEEAASCSYAETLPVPRCASPEIILHYSSIPGQEKDYIGCASDDMEKAKLATTSKSRQLPLWCTNESHHRISPNSIFSHGSKSSGVAEPVAKRPRLAQSVNSPDTSRPLKRKLDACEDEPAVDFKVRRVNQNVLILRNGDLNTEECVNPKNNRKAPQPGFFRRVMRAMKRFFTGEIKDDRDERITM